MFKYLIIILLTVQIVYAQQTVVSRRNASDNSNSAILEMNNQVEGSNRAFVLPRVELVDYSNISVPIANPANYLLAYNTKVNNKLMKGLVIFENGTWSNLMVTRSMLVENAVIKSSAVISSLFASGIIKYVYNTSTASWAKSIVSEGTATGAYKTVNNGSVLYNKIQGFTYAPSTGAIFLPKGNYVIDVNLNLKAYEATEVIYPPTLATDFNYVYSNLIGATSSTKKTHFHQYEATIFESGSTNKVSTTELSSVLSNVVSTSAEASRHIVRFSFAFKLTADKLVDFRVARKDGTYRTVGTGATFKLFGAKETLGQNNYTSLLDRQYEAGKADLLDFSMNIQRASLDL